MLLTPAQIKPKLFESRQNSFFCPGWMRLMFTSVLGHLAASTVILVPNLSEGTDRVGGQLHGDKECPFSGITKSGRVWRKVPESDARSRWYIFLVRVLLHQGGLSSGWSFSFIRVVSHQAGLSSDGLSWEWSLVRLVSHQGGHSLDLEWFSNYVVTNYTL